MANIRNGNTFFIDTQFSSTGDGTELLIKGARVSNLIFSTSSTSNALTIADAVTGQIKLKATNAAVSTLQFEFKENAMHFPNGIRPVTVTNCTLSCILVDPRG